MNRQIITIITELKKIVTELEEYDQNLANNFQLEMNVLEIINDIKYSDNR